MSLIYDQPVEALVVPIHGALKLKKGNFKAHWTNISFVTLGTNQ
jgi:hypothetical protein